MFTDPASNKKKKRKKKKENQTRTQQIGRKIRLVSMRVQRQSCGAIGVCQCVTSDWAASLIHGFKVNPAASAWLPPPRSTSSGTRQRKVPQRCKQLPWVVFLFYLFHFIEVLRLEERKERKREIWREIGTKYVRRASVGFSLVSTGLNPRSGSHIPLPDLTTREILSPSSICGSL